MNSFALFLFLLPAFASAVVNWPWDQITMEPQVTMAVGTPPQPLRIGMGDFGANHSSVLSLPYWFDVSASSTFNVTGHGFHEEKQVFEISGTDDVSFGNENRTFLNKPLLKSLEGGELGWNLPTDGSLSFLQSVLKELEEEVVVFSFDRPIYEYFYPGLITLGGRPADRCGSEWTYVPAIPITRPEDQWSLSVDEFSFGTLLVEDAGTAHFSLQSTGVRLPAAYQKPLARAWGNVGGPYDVPCDTTVELVLKMGEQEIRLLPEDYVDQDSHYIPNGNCIHNIEFEPENEFILPVNVYERHCLLLDYAGRRMGFAPRLLQ